jgi:cytoskeletal protein CcmA (bactofilin family)
MSDIHVRRGETATLDRVEGNLIVGSHARIEASNGKSVVVTGGTHVEGVHFEGSAEVNCNFECDSLECHRGQLKVNGNLTVHKRLRVGHSVQVTGLIKAEIIDVGGKIEAGAINCDQIRVGGHAEIKSTFEASSVEVGGKIVAGIVKLGDLNVGGEAEVGGGSITGHIRVGGKFLSKAPLEFGELLVYGRGFLPANCKGNKLSTFGKICVDGNMTCDQIQVSGSVEVLGDCHAERIEVGGKFEVAGSLFISDRLEGFGATEIAGNFEGTNLRVGGKFQANKIMVKEEADVSGKVETKQGLKAKQVIVRSGTQIDGPIIGERVEIGKSPDLSYGAWGPTWLTKWATMGGKAQDIYAQEVMIGAMCKVARIFADTVRLEQGCAVEQVTYTKELKADFGVAIHKPPQKVLNLPSPPF